MALKLTAPHTIIRLKPCFQWFENRLLIVLLLTDKFFLSRNFLHVIRNASSDKAKVYLFESVHFCFD